MATGNIRLFGIKVTQDDAIHLEDLMFITDSSDNLCLTTEGEGGGDSDAVVRGMARSGSPSLHAILKESPSEDDSTSSKGESSGFPLWRACNAMISVDPILNTSTPEEILAPQTILMRPQQTTIRMPLFKN
jgi:hypothetical protein